MASLNLQLLKVNPMSKAPLSPLSYSRRAPLALALAAAMSLAGGTAALAQEKVLRHGSCATLQE